MTGTRRTLDVTFFATTNAIEHAASESRRAIGTAMAVAGGVLASVTLVIFTEPGAMTSTKSRAT